MLETYLLCARAAMSFLIPIGVVVYAAIGGLKATFTTSYMHTVIIFVLCLIFMFKVFVPNDLLGGIDDVRTIPSAPFFGPLPPGAPCEVPSSCMSTACCIFMVSCMLEVSTCRQRESRGAPWLQIYSRLETMATVLPVSGQQDGSYLTMWSSAGLQCAPSALNCCPAHNLLFTLLCNWCHPLFFPRYSIASDRTVASERLSNTF